MNVVATVLLALATGTLPSAAIAGFFMFRVNRATATKVLAEAEDISKKTALSQAEAALKFSDVRFTNLEKDYQKVEKSCNSCLQKLERMERRDERRDRIEDALIDAIMEAIPLLDANAEQTLALRRAATAARQAKYDLDDE